MAQGQPKPGATGINKKPSAPKSYHDRVKSSVTPEFLRNIENEATKDRPQSQTSGHTLKSSIFSTRTVERNTSRNNTPQNDVQTGNTPTNSSLNHPSHQPRKSSKNQPNNFRSNLKKRGPIAAIIAVIAGAVIAIFSGQSFLFAQLETLITKATDTQYTYMTKRSRVMTKQMLSGERNMPKYTEKRLIKNGINVNRAANGTIELDHNGTKITANNFDEVMKTNTDFRDSFERSRHGRVANFFDGPVKKILNKLGINRNRQSDVKQTADAKADELKYREDLESHYAETSDVRGGTAEDKTKTDEDTGETTTERTTSEVSAKNVDTDLDAKTKATNYIAEQSNKVADAGGLTCAAYKVGNMIAVTVSALATYQAINYFMDGMENTSKTLEEKGSESYINQFLNRLNKPETTTYTDIDTGEEKEITGAPIQSAGLIAFLASTVPVVATTRHFSREASSTALNNKIFANKSAMNTCSKIQGATAAISLATLAVPGAGFVKIATGFLVNAVKNIAIGVAVGAMLSVLIPFVAQTIFSSAPKTYKGKVDGEFFASGAYAANSKLARQGSGNAVMDKEAAIEYAAAERQVLAEEAEIDRKHRSPLDPTSPNTFLGSLISKTSPLWTSSATLLNRAGSILRTSLPTALADGENTTYATTFGDCPQLESAGMAGDAYCNSIIGADLSTVNLSDDDPTYRAVIDPNLDEEGNIKDGSDLAGYITYSMNRTSPDGIVDANILEACHTSFGILDNVPYLSDVVDIINAIEDDTSDCMKIATGEEYLHSSSNPNWDTKYKYYEAYVAENRILEQMDDSYKNPVTAFIDHYDREHPLDTSYTGILSAITGQKKEDVETTLAFAEYLLYLNDYNPSDRYQFGNDVLSTINLSNNTFSSGTRDGTIAFHVESLTRNLGNRTFDDDIESSGRDKTIAFRTEVRSLARRGLAAAARGDGPAERVRRKDYRLSRTQEVLA